MSIRFYRKKAKSDLREPEKAKVKCFLPSFLTVIDWQEDKVSNTIEIFINNIHEEEEVSSLILNEY